MLLCCRSMLLTGNRISLIMLSIIKAIKSRSAKIICSPVLHWDIKFLRLWSQLISFNYPASFSSVSSSVPPILGLISIGDAAATSKRARRRYRMTHFSVSEIYRRSTCLWTCFYRGLNRWLVNLIKQMYNRQLSLSVGDGTLPFDGQ
jgi:hypothetical protein